LDSYPHSCIFASLDRQNYLRNYRPLTLVGGRACLLGQNIAYLPFSYFCITFLRATNLLNHPLLTAPYPTYSIYQPYPLTLPNLLMDAQTSCFSQESFVGTALRTFTIYLYSPASLYLFTVTNYPPLLFT